LDSSHVWERVFDSSDNNIVVYSKEMKRYLLIDADGMVIIA
jgi:hypothetical protein